MRKTFCLIASLVITLSLAACSGAVDAPKQNETPVETEESTSSNTAPSESGKNAQKSGQETYPEIIECFEKLNENWQVSLHKRNRRLEAALLADDLTPDAAPENWDDVLMALEAAITEAEPLAKGQGFDMISAQIETEDGTILANGSGGRIQFNKFEQQSNEDGTNPPTISKFEYDQITVGMSLSQVTDIIGGSGTLDNSIGTAGVTSVTKTYTWQGDNGGYASVLFDDYEVYYKIDVGLS